MLASTFSRLTSLAACLTGEGGRERWENGKRERGERGRNGTKAMLANQLVTSTMYMMLIQPDAQSCTHITQNS